MARANGVAVGHSAGCTSIRRGSRSDASLRRVPDAELAQRSTGFRGLVFRRSNPIG